MDGLLQVLEWLLMAAALFWVVMGMFWTRSMVARGDNPTLMTLTQTMLLMVAIVTILVLKVSPFHLIWMFPVGFVLGALCMLPQFSFLRALGVLGTLFGIISTLGLPKRRKGEEDFIE